MLSPCLTPTLNSMNVSTLPMISLTTLLSYMRLIGASTFCLADLGGLNQNTRRRVDGPGTNQSPIFMQGQLIKINPKISEPPNQNLLVWHYIRSILHPLCRRRRICFWVQDRHRNRDHPPFWSLCSVWPWNARWHRRKKSKTELVFSPPPGFFNTLTLPLTYLTNSTLALQKKESDKKRRTREDE